MRCVFRAAAQSLIPVGSQPFSITINFGGTVSGNTLVAQSTWVIRWNGSPRPTTLSSSIYGTPQASAAISAADVAQPGFNEITAMDQATGIVFQAVSWFLVSAKVAANDAAYDSVRNRFYVSVPTGQATAGASAESIVSIDASSGAILNAINVGSKPTLLAISDDSSYLYVYDSGSAFISRIVLASFILNLQIPLQSGATVLWMAVVPGAPLSMATTQPSSREHTQTRRNRAAHVAVQPSRGSRDSWIVDERSNQHERRRRNYGCG
jgi:hypothetical protein